MAISAEAMDGLRTIVAWNPSGARFLLGVLRERPAWVAHKDDPYGPLHLIQHADEPAWTTRGGRLTAIARGPFPIAPAAAFERFGREWRRREFTKAELADAIEGILAGLPENDGESATG